MMVIEMVVIKIIVPKIASIKAANTAVKTAIVIANTITTIHMVRRITRVTASISFKQTIPATVIAIGAIVTVMKMTAVARRSMTAATGMTIVGTNNSKVIAQPIIAVVMAMRNGMAMASLIAGMMIIKTMIIKTKIIKMIMIGITGTASTITSPVALRTVIGIRSVMTVIGISLRHHKMDATMREIVYWKDSSRIQTRLSSGIWEWTSGKTLSVVKAKRSTCHVIRVARID